MANANSGSSTFFKYDAVTTICDDMVNIINKMTTEFDSIKAIINNKDNIWKGAAANRYWEYFYNGKDEATLAKIETILKTDFPNTITKAKDLVANNKNLDNILNNNNNITANNANDNIQASTITTGAYGVNTELNNSVGANDNIQANNTTTGAYGVNTELNNSVGANGNVQANSTSTNATGIDTNLINEVGMAQDVNANSIKTNAEALNQALFDHVGMKDLSTKSDS